MIGLRCDNLVLDIIYHLATKGLLTKFISSGLKLNLRYRNIFPLLGSGINILVKIRSLSIVRIIIRLLFLFYQYSVLHVFIYLLEE